jgi:hypothetical protein
MAEPDKLGWRQWTQEDTERDYSQTEYGINTLVVGDGGDSENPLATLIQGDDVGGKIAWI